VRLNCHLIHLGDEPLLVPTRFSLKSGHLSGGVIGPEQNDRADNPGGQTRTFSAVASHMDIEKVEGLKTEQRKTGSVTLLFGDGGPLFPVPGDYRIQVELTWEHDGRPVRTKAEKSVTILPPQDEAHCKAARAVLDTPEALLTLAFGGDQYPAGNDALRLALDSPVLRPHFRLVEFRIRTQDPQAKEADLNAAFDALTGSPDAVLNADELKYVASVLDKSLKQVRAPDLLKRIFSFLEKQTSQCQPDVETRKQVAKARADLAQALKAAAKAEKPSPDGTGGVWSEAKAVQAGGRQPAPARAAKQAQGSAKLGATRIERKKGAVQKD
jgi:hypothetical protein